MLDPQHLQEWRRSGVHDEIIELNVRSLSGYLPLQQLVYSSQLQRLNGGRVPSWVLHRYAHTEKGGWWLSGLDPLDGFQSMDWGCFKPDSPRHDSDGRVLKYEHPLRVETSAFFLRVSLSVWQRIAKRYRVPMPPEVTIAESGEAVGFWEWVFQNKVPVIVSEGGKKSASLLSAGFVGVALPGVNSGYRQPKDENGNPVGDRVLIRELQIFKDHPILFCFDRDTKESTIARVNLALERTANLLVKQGCTVRIINWQEPEKGVDDYLVAHGIEAFERCIKQPQTLKKWAKLSFKNRRRRSPSHSAPALTHEPDIQLDQEFLGKLNIPSNAKLVGIRSPKGSGKTRTLGEVAAEANRQGKWVLLISHRIQLAQELCDRMGLPHVSQVSSCEFGKQLGFGLCVDSLHPRSQAQFKAQNWRGGVVILDEIEQVLWHLLNSSTCQSNRVAILKEFKELISNALKDEDSQVILSDADLSDISIDYIQKLGEADDITPWIIENTYKSKGWQVFNYEDTSPAAMVATLEEHVQQGGKPFVICSAQKTKSKFGTRCLEAHFANKFPSLKILRIDSESVSDKTHPAYGCVSNLNKVLPEYDLVLASPAIETGVSIDVRSHFSSVWGIFQGVSPENSARQALARVREPVPRHVWAAPYGLGAVGNGAVDVKDLLNSQHKLAQANIQKLKDADFGQQDLEKSFDPTSLRAWAGLAIRINSAMIDYRGSILAGLRGEGHQVVDVNGCDGDKVKEELTEVRDCEHMKEAQAIAVAPSISQGEFDKLKEQRSKTQQERYEERKYGLKLRYGTDVTPDLVIKDDDQWHPKIQMHYYATVGKQYLPSRDKKRLATIREQGEGQVWLPDMNRSLLSAVVESLEPLGILNLMAPIVRQFRNNDDDLQEFARKAIAWKWDIKAILGVSISEKDSPIVIAQKLLEKLGLKLTFLRKEGARGKQERIYVYIPPDDGRDQVFTAWLARDEAARLAEMEKVSTDVPVVNTGYKKVLEETTDYQTQIPQTTSAAVEVEKVSTDIPVVNTGYKKVLEETTDYQTQIPQTTSEAGEAGKSWVGKALRVMQGMYEGRVVRIVEQLDDCFEVCEGWLVSLREIERGYYTIA